MDLPLEPAACVRRAVPSPGANAPTRWALVAVLCLFPWLAACEEGVEPFLGTDVPYTIWGFMNAGTDTQFVRVFPIRDTLIPDPDAAIDARVFSTNLMTGERREWTYEAVQFDSLIEGHVFWSPFRAEHNHRYRLEVVRSDGEIASSEITVPSAVDFDFDVNENSAKYPIQLRGDIPNLVGLRVTYDAVNIPPERAWPVGTTVAGAVRLPVTIEYANVAEKTDDGWEIVVDLARDIAAVREIYRLNCLVTGERGSAPDIWLNNIEFSALAADSTWNPPGGTFDPNILSVPGTFSNVENGYGFFGAGQAVFHEWTPAVNVRINAGFNFEPQCQGLSPQPIPSCMNPPEPCLNENFPTLWRIWLR